ncbi:MAG: hypothetical protein QHH24_02350 [Candidatus Bathyarchaeota archaeon]|nr:hypothetical protein [Candidatus Bathyarchaeota archaeon]
MRRKWCPFILVCVLIIALTSSNMLFPNVKAADVAITFVSPIDHYARVGVKAEVAGTINTTGGACQVWFRGLLVNETTATQNNVSASFIVPPVPRGNYTLILRDVSANINATTWLYIQSTYYLKVKAPSSPRQLQQGDSVEVNVNITGGVANTVYVANITVKTPANQTYFALVKLSNTTDTGTALNLTTLYPTSFGGKSNTNFIGTYTVAFNKTLATDTFFVGLTNFTQYHRSQNVDIKAAGYNQTENVALRITFGSKLVYSADVTAGEGGRVHTNWPVPSDASIGTYNLNITSASTVNRTRKNPADVQAFTVPGFNVNMTTRNLAKDRVSSVVVHLFEGGVSLLNVTSDSDGFCSTLLEIGNYTYEAYFKNAKVDAGWINVTEAMATEFICSLTNLRVLVVNEDLVRIPEVSIYFKPDNRTLTPTDINGTVIERSLLPNVTKPYVLNASRYGRSFNVTSIPTLLVNGSVIPWFNVTITCPMLRLQANVTGVSGQPVVNARVRVRDLVGGLSNEGTTDAQGMVVLNCTFGSYSLKVYGSDGIEIHETTVEIFQNRNLTINCPLYGFSVHVKVVDYFGQPISNVNVTIRLKNLAQFSHLTLANGSAVFDNVSGDTVQVSVRFAGQTELSAQNTFTINEQSIKERSVMFQFKIGKYIVLMGFLVETSHLALALLIAMSLLVILAIEIYRQRKHVKLEKEESE